MATLSTPRSPTVRPPAVGFRLLSDARLAKLAAGGRDGAMAAIFERYHQALHRYCYAIVGNEHDAADALQNTMVRALRSLPGETRSIALRPWLYRIAHNESISLLRARRSDSDLDAAAHLSDVAAAGAVESRERLRSLTADLAELTERQRGAVLMRELSGMEFAEIADVLHTTAPAVKQSVYEARRALQALREGRAMDCDVVQRTISDGDGRALRAMRIRGHLRECACCRAFDASLRERPAALSALIPPLPVAVAAGMIHSILGGGGSGGGGLGVGLAGGAKATVGASLATKTAIALSVGATIAGGAAVAAPTPRPAAHDSVTPGAPAVVQAKPRRGAEPKATAARKRSSRTAVAGAAKRLRTAVAADGPGASDTPPAPSSTGSQTTSSTGAPAGGVRAIGTGAKRSGGRKAAATSSAKPSRAGKPRPASRSRASTAHSRRPAASSRKPSRASAPGGRSRPKAVRPPPPAAANASKGASPGSAAPGQAPATVPSSAGSPAATPPEASPGGGGHGKAAPAVGRR